MQLRNDLLTLTEPLSSSSTIGNLNWQGDLHVPRHWCTACDRLVSHSAGISACSYFPNITDSCTLLSSDIHEAGSHTLRYALYCCNMILIYR